MTRQTLIALCSLPLVAAAGCKPKVSAPARGKPARSASPRLSRADFNRLAVLTHQPFYWTADKKNPGVVDPNELIITGVGAARSHYVKAGKLTRLFHRAYARMVEYRRREAVTKELNQARPSLVSWDFTKAPAADRQVVRHVTAAARVIEDLFALQLGSYRLRGCLATAGTESRALFFRNQAPWCTAPGTEKDPFCNACPGFPERRSGLYPGGKWPSAAECAKFRSHPRGKELMSPFAVIRGTGAKLRAVPYHHEWGGLMRKVATHLRHAAAALVDPEEKAFRRYLLAAADGFETNRWETADEAWAAMNVSNSKWYLRIAPDEVGFDPCNRKGGFHVSFARIDPDSLYWQRKLTPHRGAMEEALANLIGPPYQARKVSFHLPDFVEIILNAGDSRSEMGATIGQSLPNWGKVAREGRGRTVAMTNLFADADSLAVRRARAASLLCDESMAMYTDHKRIRVLDVILHEATHNFGPASGHRVGGKSSAEIFGGAIAGVLEELKAQSGTLYFVGFLKQHNELTEKQAYQVYNSALLWAFRHISRGMTDARGRPRKYSQLAAIQVGALVRQGVVRWEEDRVAANHKDTGCFHIDYLRMAGVANQVMQQVGRIKATGNVEEARSMIAEGIGTAGLESIRAATITKRIDRYPRESLVYRVRY